MNFQLFAALPAWISALVLVFAIGLPTTMWQGFQQAGANAKVDGARATSMRLGVFLFVWVTAAVWLSLRGFFEADPVARFPHLTYSLLPLLIGVILWPASRSFRETLRAIGPDWLIRIQHYRTLGFIYLVCWYIGLMPAAIAIPAGVGDLIVGLSALWVAKQVRGHRAGAGRIATIWNIFGLLDVLTAVIMGVLTSPNPLQMLAKDAPDLVITTFPMVLLTAIVVPLSVLCHIYSLRVGTRRATV